MDARQKEPTNAKILAEIRTFAKVQESHEQKIGILMNWKIAVEAVDRYTAAQSKKPVKTTEKPVDWTKIIIYTLSLTASAIAVIGVMAGK